MQEQEDYRLKLNKLEYIISIAGDIKALEASIRKEDHAKAMRHLDRVIFALDNEVFLAYLKKISQEWKD